MHAKSISMATAIITGFFYFVAGADNWVLSALLIATLVTRFSERTKNIGKLIEILFIFYLITFGIYNLGIDYPYSLIFVLTVLVVLIFYEGPEWSALYFTAGKTADYFKWSVVFIIANLMVYGATIYVRYPNLRNPVPGNWPLDVVLLTGIGFAFYRAIVEETIFRSFIFQRANSAIGGLAAIATQGVLYGLMLYRVGVPSGVEGLILGSFFGMSSGYLVYKSGSVLLSLFLQFVVTLGIFIELTVLGRL